MLCLVIRHAVAILAHKVQLVCIACDRELTAFFRVGNLDDGGFGGKGIADGDLLVGSEVNIAVVPLKLGALQLCGGVFALTEINAVLAVLDRAVLNDQLAAGLIIVIRPCRFARRNGSIAARAIHSGTIDAQCAAVPYLQCRGLVATKRRLLVDILVGVGISTAEKVGGGARHKHIAVGSGDIGICDVQRCIIGGAQRRTLYEYLDVLIAGVRAADDIDPTVDGVQDPARAGGCHIIEGRAGGIHDHKRRAVAIVAVVGAAIDGHIGSLICFNSTQDGVHGEIVKRPVAAAQIACGDVVTLHVIGAAVKHCGAREAVFGIEATVEGEALCRLDGLPHSVDGHALGSADCNKVRTVFFIPSLIKGRFSGDVDDHILVLSVDHDPLCIGTVYGINLAAAMLFNEILVDDVAAGQETGRCRLSGGLCRRIGIFLCAHSAFKFCTSLQSKCAHGKDRGHHAACKYRTDEPCAKLLHKDNSSLVFFVHAGFFRLPARFKHLKYSISAARRNLHSVRTFWTPPFFRAFCKKMEEKMLSQPQKKQPGTTHRSFRAAVSKIVWSVRAPAELSSHSKGSAGSPRSCAGPAADTAPCWPGCPPQGRRWSPAHCAPLRHPAP